MADQVGETGHVTAIDIDPRFLAALGPLGRPNVAVLRHDIARRPAPGGPVRPDPCARLVFIHLAAAREVLGRVAAKLAAGGWLVIEDFDPAPESEFISYAAGPDRCGPGAAGRGGA